eukprot:8190838-Ditylum_brightwellii.AAC.1
MIRYSNKLPGLSPTMNIDQVKKLIFDQHPEKWHRAYVWAGKSLNTDTLAEMIQFMSNEKLFADMDDDNQKKKGGDNKRNKQ